MFGRRRGARVAEPRLASPEASPLERLGAEIVESAEALPRHIESALAELRPRLRGVLHEAAAFLTVIAGAVICLLADTTLERAGLVVFALSAVALFAISATYHRRRWSARARARMAKLDHSMIFVFIAGTYTPFVLIVLEGSLRVGFLSLIWAGALGGVVLRTCWPGAPRWLPVCCYLGLGWVALAIIPQVLAVGGTAVLALLLAGGVMYSLGALAYALRRPNPLPSWFGFHEVFHACTVVAFATHYASLTLLATT